MLSPSIRDYRYLLSRGYRQKTALNLVVNRYKLSEGERHVLARGVLPLDKAEAIKSRLIGLDEVRGQKLVVDGYNVLITVESLIDDKVMECDDTMIRDTRGIFGKYVQSNTTGEALDLIKQTLAYAGPSDILVVFDSQVSLSGLLAAKVTKLLGPMGEAVTDSQTDSRLIEEGGVLATSDSNLLLKATKAVDIPKKILEERFKTKEVFSTLDVE